MNKMSLAFAILLLGGAAASAEPMAMPMNADEIKWGPAPNVFPAGAQIAIVSGDPFKKDCTSFA